MRSLAGRRLASQGSRLSLTASRSQPNADLDRLFVFDKALLFALFLADLVGRWAREILDGAPCQLYWIIVS